MKKVISLLLGLCLLACGLGGCGGKPAPETAAPTAPPAREVRFEREPDLRKYPASQLQFFTLLSEEDPQAAAICQAVDFFARQTGAEVDVVWFAGEEAALLQALAGDRGDIFELPGSSLQSSGLDFALDLTELAQEAEYEAHSYPALRQQVVQRCGFLAGIPWTPYLTGVYYNQDAFASCGIQHMPETWEEFLTACRSLAAGGFSPLTMDAENARIPLELHLERNLGAEKLTQILDSGDWDEDPQTMALAEQLCMFVECGFLAKGTPAAYPAGQNKLALSNAAMAAGSNRLCSQVIQAAQAEMTWGVFPWPGEGPGTGTAVDADVLAIRRSSRNVQAAFDFIMLLATGEFDQLRADLSGGIPADPGNVSTIAGAAEALTAAQPRSLGLVAETDKIRKLWQGKYQIKAPEE